MLGGRDSRGGKSSDIASRTDTGMLAHTHTYTHIHVHKLDALQGGRLKHLFPLMRDMSLTRVSDAQRGNNRVGFNSINLLHLSLYHINTCQLRWRG